MKNKKKVKSKKGFTLIELLGTIVIIGVLGTIAVASVINIKKSSNARFDKSQIELMVQAGQTYFTDNKRLLPIVEGQTNFVTLSELIEKGYISKLYNAKKEEFDVKESYVWVQKEKSGEYKYDCYCLINGKKLAGTNDLPISETNNSTITFEYNGDFYKSNDKYYTNGKSNATVRVSLIRDEVTSYKYEIYKRVLTEKDEYAQYKVSQRDQLTSSTVDIQLKATSYSDGEYYIRVTTYNKSGSPNQSTYSKGIYVDKTPPTCSIKTDYEKDPTSVQSIWYSSKSKNKNDQEHELGIDKTLPIYVEGDDKGSGIKSGTYKIFSDGEYTNQIDEGTGKYKAGNTSSNGKSYYATLEDNVGNKATCNQVYYIDTTPPTCSVDPVSVNGISSTGWYNVNSTLGAELGINLTKNDNVVIADYGLTTANTITYNKTDSATQNDTNKSGVTWYGYIKDQAGNANSCSNSFKVDVHAPTVANFNLSSTNTNYNTIDPNIYISVYDHINDDENNNNDITYGFYSNSTPLSNRPYTTQSKKIADNQYESLQYTIGRIDEYNGAGASGYNGATYNINVSVLDEAGNETIQPSANYTVYKNCTVTNASVGAYGACSAECGGGIQYAPEIYTDSNTSESCGSVENVYTQECNTNECLDDDTTTDTKLECPTVSSKTTARKWVNTNVDITIKYPTSTDISYTYYTKNNGKYTERTAKNDVKNLKNGNFTFKGEGKRRLKIVVEDTAGNKKNCYSDSYYIDKTAPDLKSLPLSENSSFQRSGCKTGLTCRLAYGQAGQKYVGVQLTTDNNTGAKEHSPIADWGAQAKYEKGGENCAWGDGIDYRWSGESVCTSSGSGSVKRCYKVKDAAGNTSEKVCTCQNGDKVTNESDISKCF